MEDDDAFEEGAATPEDEERRASSRVRSRPSKLVNYCEDEESDDLVGSEEEKEAPKSEVSGVEKLLSLRKSQFGETEFLCKFRGKSYLHVEWLSEKDVKDLDPRYGTVIQRFKNKRAGNKIDYNEDGEEEPFDPRYTLVERILAETTNVYNVPSEEIEADLSHFLWLSGKVKDDRVDLLNHEERQGRGQHNQQIKKLYLVKWQELSYKESTWEFELDVADDFKIAQFHRRNRIPTTTKSSKKHSAFENEFEFWPGLWTAASRNPESEETSTALSVAAACVEGTRAREPVTIPEAFKHYVLQGELCGLLPGDEIIAIEQISLQGQPLNIVTSHIQARITQLRNSNSESKSFAVTFRRFVFRFDKHGSPTEPVLYNVRFGLGSLGLMLKSFLDAQIKRIVPKPESCLPCVFVEATLFPDYYTARRVISHYCDPALRCMIISYFYDLLAAWDGGDHGISSLSVMANLKPMELGRWLSGWPSNGGDDGVDFNTLKKVEAELWEMVERAHSVHKFSTYGLVSMGRLDSWLFKKTDFKALNRGIDLVFKSLRITKVYEKNKSSKKEQPDEGHVTRDNFRVHRLVECLPLLDELIASVEDSNPQLMSKRDQVLYQELRIIPSIGFDGSAKEAPDEFQLGMFDSLDKVWKSIQYHRDLKLGRPITHPEVVRHNPTLLPDWNDLHRSEKEQLERDFTERQRNFAMEYLVSNMPLPRGAHVGACDIMIQRELLRQEKIFRQNEEKQSETEQSKGTMLGLKQQRMLLNQLRRKQFIPYSVRNPPRYKSGNMLRSYQLHGINWILEHWYKGISCILADEMGLGKTVQVVATLEHLRTKESLRGPYLIIAPLSTIGHWNREIETWTDMNLCKYYDSGGAEAREAIRKFEWYFPGMDGRKDIMKFNVMVTTYETFMADIGMLADIPWLGLIVDEGHRLRTSKSKLLQMLSTLKGNPHRLILTGTPLQNNIGELFSLLNFIDPIAFSNRERFLEIYGDMRDNAQLDALQSEIAPYMLRRVKEDVEKSIPPKIETIIDVELTILQKRYYRAIFDKNRAVLYKGCSSGNKPQLINVEMELRKCCNHPYLILGVHDNELKLLRKTVRNAVAKFVPKKTVDSFKSTSSKKTEDDMEDDDSEDSDEDTEIINSVLEKTDSKARDDFEAILELIQVEKLVRSSGKLVLVDKLLPKLRSEGHKVLIFSQMVKMLDVLENYCHSRNYPVERLDGGVQGSLRQGAIDRFSDPDSNSFIFLLSTRAGGVGINLTAADTVIIFDSDWNPQNDSQAQARCHRIGQRKEVKIYRLVAKATYEETMLRRAAMKLGLERAVLGSVRQDLDPDVETKGVGGRNMTPKELEQMLREGAYYHLQDDKGEAAKSFVSSNIEDILKSNARTIVMDPSAKNQESSQLLNKLKHNTVTKSTFKSEHDDGIDVNDPEFWSKVLPEPLSADTLLNKVDDQAEVSQLKRHPEKCLLFMQDVRQVVRDTVSQRNAGNLVADHEMDSVKGLLLQITNLRGVFGSANFKGPKGKKQGGKSYVDLCNKWAMVLENLNQRRVKKSKKKDAESSDDDLFSEDSEEDMHVQPTCTPPVYSDLASSSEEEQEIETTRKPRAKSAPMSDVFTWNDDQSEPDVMADHLTEVCTICVDGGEIVVCDGPCKCAFHPACLGEETQKKLNKLRDDQEFFCPDCEAGCHVCMLCDKTGYTGVSGETAVYKCVDENCGRFHHMECIKKASKAQVIDEAAGEFKCPLHRCDVCDNVDRNVSVHCIRCTRGFHNHCVDHATCLRLHQNLVICSCTSIKRKMGPLQHSEFDMQLREAMQSQLPIKRGRGRPPKATGSPIILLKKRGRPASMAKKLKAEDDDFEQDDEDEEPLTIKRPKSEPDVADLIDVSWEHEEGVSKVCALCTKEGMVEGDSENPILPYPFIQKKGTVDLHVWLHRDCALSSPEVYVNAQGEWFNVMKAVRRGRLIRCAVCNQRGATLGCFNDNCKLSFHVPCARSTNWDNTASSFFCLDHRGEQSAKRGRGRPKKKKKTEEEEAVRLQAVLDGNQVSVNIRCDSIH